MKKILILSAIVSILSACSKAPEQVNNAGDLEHDEASRIELVLTPGEPTDTTVGGSVYAAGFTPDKGAEDVVFNAYQDLEQGKVSFDHPEGIALVPERWYRIQINLYNEAGKNINGSIIGFANQIAAHQFFFIPRLNGENLFDRYVSYRYGDMTPNGTLIMPPLGFTGYIRLHSDLPAGTMLGLVLVHVVPPATKTYKKGLAYPFHSPSAALLSATDVNFSFPITLKHT